MNMLDELPSNQWPKVEGMVVVEERSSKQRPEMEGKDMVDERPSKQRTEVEGMDMVEDTTTTEVDAKVVEREHEGVILAKHLTNNEAERC
jgi:hypothetical protein